MAEAARAVRFSAVRNPMAAALALRSCSGRAPRNAMPPAAPKPRGFNARCEAAGAATAEGAVAAAPSRPQNPSRAFCGSRASAGTQRRRSRREMAPSARPGRAACWNGRIFAVRPAASPALVRDRRLVRACGRQHARQLRHGSPRAAHGLGRASVGSRTGSQSSRCPGLRIKFSQHSFLSGYKYVIPK